MFPPFPLLAGRLSEPALNSQIGQQAENSRHRAEHDHDLILAPAAPLQMMVQGRHLEKALAMGGLEVSNLYNIGQSFQNVDNSHQN